MDRIVASTPAERLAGVLSYMGRAGCTYEQRRFVADQVWKLRRQHDRPVYLTGLTIDHRRITFEVGEFASEFHYPPAEVPSSFGGTQ